MRSITDIAHVLNKKTVAEQVESEDDCELLRSQGVDLAQGFGLHRRSRWKRISLTLRRTA